MYLSLGRGMAKVISSTHFNACLSSNRDDLFLAQPADASGASDHDLTQFLCVLHVPVQKTRGNGKQNTWASRNRNATKKQGK